MKLQIELVPSPLWYKNVRTALGPKKWKTEYSDPIRAEKGKCEVCGSKDQLELHEKWEYKEEIQKLAGFLVLCNLCHSVKHWGHTVGIGGKRLKAVMKHATKINGCTKEEWERNLEREFKEWAERSKKEWKTDWSLVGL